MKIQVLCLIALIVIMSACGGETGTRSSEKLGYYKSGEVLKKEIKGEDPEKGVATTYEYYTKKGVCVLKFIINEKTKEVQWISEGFSGVKEFADEEEKAELNSLYKYIGIEDPQYQQGIKFISGWYLYTSPFGFTAEMPVQPEVREQGLEPGVSVTEASCTLDGFTFNLGCFSSTAVKSDADFEKFFGNLTAHNKILTLVEEKEVVVAGIKGVYRKVKVETSSTKMYSTVVYLPLKHRIISMSVVGKTDFVDAEVFDRYSGSLHF